MFQQLHFDILSSSSIHRKIKAAKILHFGRSGNAIQLQGSWLNYFSNFLPSASYYKAL